MWNWAFAVFFLAGYAAGLRVTDPAWFTIVKPLFDRFEIRRYPINPSKGVIRDDRGKLALLDVKEQGYMTIVENYAEEDALIEIERKEMSIPFKETVINKTPMLAFTAVFFALTIVANYLNVFKIDLVSAFTITAAAALVFNITALRDKLLTPSSVITVVSTQLIDNESYARDLLNGRLREMAKKYNALKRQLIKKEFELDYKVTKEVLDVVRALKLQPPAAEEDEEFDEEEEELEGDEE
jgi:hypothetical protein